MVRKITDAERRRRVGYRHRLARENRTDDVAGIVRSMVALHSSDPATVHLSATARMKEPSIPAVERALYEDRSIVRHHAMRRTIWVMPIDHAQRAHAATTEKIAQVERKRTEAALEKGGEVSDPARWLADAKAEVIELLSRESLATRAIGERLPHLVVPLEFGSAKHSARLNSHTKVLQGAGFDGNIVRCQPNGTWVSAEYPWSETASWLGQALVGRDKREAAAELVHAWLEAFGPATETDLVWWFGDTKTLIRTALEDCEAEPVTLDDGADGWIATGDHGDTDDPGPWIRLLPGLDPTAMGWKQRDFYLDPRFVEPMFDRFGNIGPSIWMDGKIIGGWAQHDDATIVLELFQDLSKAQRKMLDEAIDEVDTVVAGVSVKPRFPARMQKPLLA